MPVTRMAAKAMIMEVRAWMRASAILNKGGAYPMGKESDDVPAKMA